MVRFLRFGKKHLTSYHFFCHTVLPQPVVSQDIIKQAFTEGEDAATIQCPLRFGSLHQHYNVRWTVDGNQIQNNPTYSILHDPTETLIVRNVNRDHRSRFQCVSTLNGQYPVKSPLVLLLPYGKLPSCMANYLLISFVLQPQRHQEY